MGISCATVITCMVALWNTGTHRSTKTDGEDEVVWSADVSVSGFLCHWEGVSQREQVQTSLVVIVYCYCLHMLRFLTVKHMHLFRFAVALDQFSDSLQMVKNQITPGKLTWPLTKEIVKETETDYFKVSYWRFVFISDLKIVFEHKPHAVPLRVFTPSVLIIMHVIFIWHWLTVNT